MNTNTEQVYVYAYAMIRRHQHTTRVHAHTGRPQRHATRHRALELRRVAAQLSPGVCVFLAYQHQQYPVLFLFEAVGYGEIQRDTAGHS